MLYECTAIKLSILTVLCLSFWYHTQLKCLLFYGNTPMVWLWHMCSVCCIVFNVCDTVLLRCLVVRCQLKALMVISFIHPCVIFIFFFSTLKIIAVVVALLFVSFSILCVFFFSFILNFCICFISFSLCSSFIDLFFCSYIMIARQMTRAINKVN